MIKKFNLATAGRNGNYDAKGSDEASSNETKVADASAQVIQIINLLGGRNNIADVDACMTRYVSPYIIQSWWGMKQVGNKRAQWALS